MADDENKAEIEAQDEEQLLAEDTEMTEGGEGEHVKTEEELEEELKETKITIPRYSPHNLPEWKLDDMRSRWPWHLRIYPIDQEDCRNCILDTVTKISQEAWYYVPKRKNGEGVAELTMGSNSEAKSVMARVVRMPFYHNFVTFELTKKKKVSGSSDDKPQYEEVEESATIVYDTSKCEKIKNTASSKGGLKRRTLWVRYLSDDTTPELLRVVFPFAQSATLHTHEDLRIAEVKTNSKTDVLLFMKGYLTTVVNNKHVLALQNKEYNAEGEDAIKQELEANVTPLESLDTAPVSVAERSEQRKDDKNLSARVLKRTLQQQSRAVEPKRKDPMRNRSGEPPAKRGGRGNWGDRYDGRREGGRGGGGGGRYGGYGGGGYGGGGPRGGPAGYGAGMLDPHGMAAEMMMMQAQLNHTIQNQLMMLGPGAGGGYGGGHGGGGGGRKEGRRGGGGRGGRKW